MIPSRGSGLAGSEATTEGVDLDEPGVRLGGLTSEANVTLFAAAASGTSTSTEIEEGSTKLGKYVGKGDGNWKKYNRSSRNAESLKRSVGKHHLAN